MARCSLRMSIQLLRVVCQLARVAVQPMGVNIACHGGRHQIGDRLAGGEALAQQRRRQFDRRHRQAIEAEAADIRRRPSTDAPGRTATAIRTRASSSRQRCQLCSPACWSWPISSEPAVPRLAPLQLEHGIDRVARPAALAARTFELEARIAELRIGDRQFEHRRAVRRRRPSRRDFCHGWPAGIQRSSSSARSSSALRASARWARCTGSKLPPNRPMRRLGVAAGAQAIDPAAAVRLRASPVDGRRALRRASRAAAGNRCTARASAMPGSGCQS